MSSGFPLKHFAAWLIALLCLLPALAPVILQARRLIVQHEMKERLEKENLHTILVEEGRYSWVKKGREIRIDGKMFDVKKWVRKGSHTLFTGIFDEEEDIIEEQLNKKNKNSTENTILHSVQSLPVFCFVQQDYHQQLSWRWCKLNYTDSPAASLADPIGEVIVPPPRYRIS